MRIYLTGFMGAGKTSVGQALAERLGVPFADLDLAIEARAGRSVREIFAEGGEPAFRQLEHQTLLGLLERADLPDVVVATGGGTAAVEPTAGVLHASGVTVWLHPPFATILERIGALGKGDRPLFRDETQAWSLYRQRLPAYRRCDLQVDVAPDESPDEVAARIALRLPAAARG